MQRVLEELVLIREFDELSHIHHRDAVAEMPHDSEIVRDKQEREVVALLNVTKKVQDLRLDRDVERRDGFIADEKLRPQHERASDPDPLPLAAAEHMRVAPSGVSGQTDDVERLVDARLSLGAGDAEIRERLGQDTLDAHPRVER